MSVSCRYLFYLAALVEKRESHWGSRDWNKRTPDDMLLILVSQALVDAFGGPVQIVCSKSNLLNLSCFWKRSCAELIHTINQGSKNPLTRVHERSNSSWDLQRHPRGWKISHMACWKIHPFLDDLRIYILIYQGFPCLSCDWLLEGTKTYSQ